MPSNRTGCGLSGVSTVPREDLLLQARLTAFRNAVRELGWTEGRNVRFEVRWAGGDIDRMRTFANELMDLSPDVILASGTTAIAMLKQTTRSIPLVFVIVNDPLAQGLVSSVAHPGGNITGFSFMDFWTSAKRCTGFTYRVRKCAEGAFWRFPRNGRRPAISRSSCSMTRG